MGRSTIFLGWRREWYIRNTLRKLSKQRVAIFFRPENILVIEKGLPKNKKVDAALYTCHLRGWVEPVVNAIPQGELTKDGKLPDRLSGIGPMYRLTEAGWNALNRLYGWVIATCFIALVTLIFTIISLIIVIGGREP